MKVKTFWLILLKIIGISLVLNGVNVLTQSFNILSIGENRAEVISWILPVIALTVAVYFFILWLFVFKTSWLVDKLRLEKGFEEERIEINVQLPAALTIAIIVVGGIMLIDSLPQLCQQIFVFLRMKTALSDSEIPGWIILYLTEAVLGYLLMTNSRKITRFILKHTHSEN